MSVREAFSAPPTRPSFAFHPTSSGNTSVRTRPTKKPRPASTMLSGPVSKPWIEKKDMRARLAYFLTYGMMLVGCAAAAIRCYFDWRVVQLLGRVCLVLDENFDGPGLNPDVWQHEVDLGGFGNGEFEMTTSSTNNSFIKNNQLYILPTLTSDIIGRQAVFDGYTYNLTDCTNANLTACGAVSNLTAQSVINPAMSARLTTRGKKNIQYGRVEVTAKLPRGDWLWPAIWMLPENNTYGEWPLSGEIDIMEARGNDIAYPAQGINFVRGSLNWGPISWLNEVSKTFGWWTERRSRYSDKFHTYALEWSPDFLRIYVDSRLQHMLDLSFNIPFFQRGDFPASVSNASQEIILKNPWLGRGNSAPFDQPFYLILDVAVGGTNGWFPDGAGNKPWLNGALNAMFNFAAAQDVWYATWPKDEDDRAMRIDSVRMWQSC
ncbi:glycoside hydrolase family 16 protein [Vararia minispora EC-137]|uniref:Glycoside hydrolase family 16 protein n=1 Tax=Vararia minispora EC-137 TaxID=1314806 RepID=A0ACB8QPC6_9AGAM|nr:glycoside hydrolase family 16 protein [Vararia minispora EC-137]